jgi:hypothetical protein
MVKHARLRLRGAQIAVGLRKINLAEVDLRAQNVWL